MPPKEVIDAALLTIGLYGGILLLAVGVGLATILSWWRIRHGPPIKGEDVIWWAFVLWCLVCGAGLVFSTIMLRFDQ